MSCCGEPEPGERMPCAAEKRTPRMPALGPIAMQTFSGPIAMQTFSVERRFGAFDRGCNQDIPPIGRLPGAIVPRSDLPSGRKSGCRGKDWCVRPNVVRCFGTIPLGGTRYGATYHTTAAYLCCCYYCKIKINDGLRFCWLFVVVASVGCLLLSLW